MCEGKHVYNKNKFDTPANVNNELPQADQIIYFPS